MPHLMDVARMVATELAQMGFGGMDGSTSPQFEEHERANSAGDLSDIESVYSKQDSGISCVSQRTLNQRLSLTNNVSLVFQGNTVMKCTVRKKLRSRSGTSGSESTPSDAKIEIGDIWHRPRLIEVVTALLTHATDMDADAIRPTTPFAELGLGSNKALELRNSLEGYLQIDLPATLIFDHPSVDELVDAVIAARKATLDVDEVEAMEATEEPPALEGTCFLVVTSVCGEAPLASGLEGLWSLLQAQGDAIREVPPTRWDHELYFSADAQGTRTNAKHGGFIEGMDCFDATFFGISKAEAQAMDPQQRLLLSSCYGTLHGDGYDKDLLQGQPIGVYVGLSNAEWYHMSLSQPGVYTGTGVAGAIAANRISYFLGLKGPSMALDTACSSSLAALHVLGRHLHMTQGSGSSAGEESLLGGAETLHGPNVLLLRSVASMLSPDGRCKTFDASANGYVRAEGGGALLVRRTQEAADAGFSRRLGLLRAAAVNQDGRSTTLTAPNGPSQQEVLSQALRTGGLRKGDLHAVECHGTGTALGDPIEVGAQSIVYNAAAQVRIRIGTTDALTDELYLGAGKSNHGHLEAAAGLAGLLKVLACFEKSRVPPNVHFAKLNPHINLKNSRLQVPQQLVELEPEAIVGVSSFGFGGTNSHAVLARSPGGFDERQPRVGLLFTGQGSFRGAAGRELYRVDAIFRGALDRALALARPSLKPGEDLQGLMFSDSAEAKLALQGTRLTQLATICLELALAEMWRARSLRPAAVLGHSLGEYAAAVFVGALSLEDAVALVAARGRLIEEHVPSGAGRMAAIFAQGKAVQELIDNQSFAEGQSAAVAAINSPQQTVVSGHKDAVEIVCNLAKEHLNSDFRMLPVEHAMHSELLAPMLPAFRQHLDAANLRPPAEGAPTLVSSLTGKVATSELANPSHWCGHDEPKPMLFLEGMHSLRAMGCEAFVEVGPQPVLTRLGRECLDPAPRDLWLASLQPGQPETTQLLRTLRGLGLAFSRPSPLQPRRWPWGRPREDAGPSALQLAAERAPDQPAGSDQRSCPFKALRGLEPAERVPLLQGPLLSHISEVAECTLEELEDTGQDLFDVGLDSLSNVHLISKIREDPQLPVKTPTLAELLKCKTIADLLQHLSNHLEEPADNGALVQPTGLQPSQPQTALPEQSDSLAKLRALEPSERVPLLQGPLLEHISEVVECTVEGLLQQTHEELDNIGLDSLSNVHLISKIREDARLPVKTPTLVELLKCSTIDDLLMHLSHNLDDSAGAYLVPSTCSAAAQASPAVGMLSQGPRMYHMSHQQEHMFHCVEELPPYALNLPMTVKLMGLLDVERLRGAVAKLMARHDALRGCCLRICGMPQLVIPAACSEESYWASLSVEASEAQERLNALSRHPFSFAHGPPVRVTHLSAGSDEHYLMVCVSHIAFDGFSQGVLWRDLSRLMASPDEPLPPLRWGYGEYAEWQRVQPKGEEDAHLEFWRQQLEGLPLLELPADTPRRLDHDLEGGHYSFEVPEDTIASLVSFARSLRATLNSAVLAAIFVLMWHSKEHDVALWMPVAGRTEADGLFDMVGCFRTRVCVRARLKEDSTVGAWLGEVHGAALDAMAHATNLARLAAMSPPCPYAYTYFSSEANWDLDPKAWGVRETSIENMGFAPHKVAKMELVFYAWARSNGSLSLRFEARAHYDARTMQAMLGHWAALFPAMAGSREAPLATLPARPPTQRELEEAKITDAGGR